MKLNFTYIIGMLLLCSCNNSTDKQDNQAITVDNGIISIPDSSSVLSKIKVEKIDYSEYNPDFTTSGVVKAIPTLYAEIAMPFAGRITKSFIKLGQTVKKGTPLFELSSPSFFETAKAYFGAKQERDQALKSLKREKDLLANHVGVKKDAEEAEVNYHLKQQDFENASSALKVFQVNPSQIKLGEPLIVRSPINGKVVKNNVVIGQYVKEDAESLATIADLSKVWVIAEVKEKDIHYIDKLQQVDIHLSAAPDSDIKGKIYHVSDMLDETTRSVEVIIECENPNGKIKPFMYGTVKLTDKPEKVILIPTSSLLQDEESHFVIKSIGKNKYKRVPVTTGNVKNNMTIITKGLNSGDEVITDGAFYLLDDK